MKLRTYVLLIFVLFSGKCSCEVCDYEDDNGNTQLKYCEDNYHCCEDNRSCCADFWTTAVVLGIVFGALLFIGACVTVTAYCIFNICCKSAGVVGHRDNPAPPPTVSYVATTQPVQYVTNYPQPQGQLAQPLHPPPQYGANYPQINQPPSYSQPTQNPPILSSAPPYPPASQELYDKQ